MVFQYSKFQSHAWSHSENADDRCPKMQITFKEAKMSFVMQMKRILKMQIVLQRHRCKCWRIVFQRRHGCSRLILVFQRHSRCRWSDVQRVQDVHSFPDMVDVRTMIETSRGWDEHRFFPDTARRRCADMIETCRDVYPFLARHVDAGDTIETCCTPEMYVIPFQTYRSGYDDRDLQRWCDYAAAVVDDAIMNGCLQSWKKDVAFTVINPIGEEEDAACNDGGCR